MANNMQLLLTAAVVIGFVDVYNQADAAKWRYQGPQGPDKWNTIEERCGGDKQSPINIYTHQVVYDKTLGHLQLSNYHKTPPNGWMIKNNGHTATITGTFDESTRPFMYGGSLPSEYDFLNMHFHWGKDENPGSEHLFNFKRYPAELHIVHVRRDFAANGSDDWQEESTGLAVLGVIIDIGPADNLHFEPIIKALSTIQYASQTAPVKHLQLRDFLPNRATFMDDDLPFFRYMGSLTTPDCFESVIWTVLQRHVYISPRQYRMLQKLNEATQPSERANAVDIHDTGHSGHAEGDYSDIVNNYRPVQPLNGRIVLSNKEFKHFAAYMMDNHAMTHQPNILSYVALFIAFFVAFLPFRLHFFAIN